MYFLRSQHHHCHIQQVHRLLSLGLFLLLFPLLLLPLSVLGLGSLRVRDHGFVQAGAAAAAEAIDQALRPKVDAFVNGITSCNGDMWFRQNLHIRKVPKYLFVVLTCGAYIHKAAEK